MMDETPVQTTTSNNQNLMAALCYLLGFVTGIVFFLIEKENKFVRFHAMQSIITFGVILVANFIFGFFPFFGPLLQFGLGIVGLVLWILLMVKAYQGETYKLPYIGEMAAKQVGM